MSDLRNIYAGHVSPFANPLCDGCTILEQTKPDHAILDYDSLTEHKVLFLSDSLKYKNGTYHAFSSQERQLIEGIYQPPPQYAAAVKCPSVKEGDMTPSNMKLCRAHLEATIDKVKPRLVYTCGNLAMKMLIKKSGIMDKRGKSYEFTTDSGHTCIVVPIYHPYTVIREPRHTYLFETDIKNAYEKYVLGKKTSSQFSYDVATSIEEVKNIYDILRDSEETMAVDIETTGLNFKKDEIMTIAISCKDNTWVIPCNHKDSPFRVGEPDYSLMWSYLAKILENPKNKKVFHNAKFDLKFLLKENIDPKNVWDTKIMHHLINENAPKSLMDLIKLYFADELENL
jgi:hypothetical protein|tara:strand:+ start:10685 stop:11707 length:1023 start_codon:yes stop_codon:yes gene_type:complete